METEKDIVADAVLDAEKAVIWARKEKSLNTEDAKKKISVAKKKSQNAARVAISQYITELEKREPKIAKRIEEFIDKTQEKDTAEKTKNKTTGKAENKTADIPALQRSLSNWRRKKGEGKPNLLNLSLLAQAFDGTYDHILGLDKRTYICADWLTYGYTLDFFSHLFITRKIDILPAGFDGICGSVTKAASKGSFNMTQHFIFNDKLLVDMFDTLNYLKQNKKETLYKEKLQDLVSKYKNEPLKSSACGADSTPSNASQGTCTDEKPDWVACLKKLPEAYGKNEAEFCRDAFIGKSTFENWVNGYNDPRIDKLFLIAITYGFSVDSILRTGASDEFIKKQQNKYTYGNTLLFIDQLLNIGTIKRVLSSKYDPFANLREQPFGNSVSYMGISSGTDQNNAMFSPREEQNAFYPGIFKIQDDFLIRLIAEMGNKIILPLNAPEDPDMKQMVFDIARSDMKELITKYNDEHLLYYHKDETGKSLTNYSKKWYLKNGCLNTSVDSDEMLKELRTVEIQAHKTLQGEDAIKQET